ncbi:MAG: extracellular solute-binding protein [Bacilli bacterium]|nr:extracellular solute-binding protein [Bacilli bacterium]
MFPVLNACQQIDNYIASDGRVQIRVSMFNSSSFIPWRDYIETQCPDISIIWEDNRNAPLNILYKAKHNEEPDIVSIRRFENDTAKTLVPYLYDLSSLDIANNFGKEYLDYYRMDDKLCWLPEPGLFDGFVANKNLFTAKGLKLPTDYQSFIDSAEKLDDGKITVLGADCKDNWTATTVLEGLGLQDFFTTPEGVSWLTKFKNGEAKSVDEAGFKKIFAKVRELKEKKFLTQEDIEADYGSLAAGIVAGNVAMARLSLDGTISTSASAGTYVALPFFGSDSSSNWIYTYPVFSLAMTKKAAVDSRKLKAATKVMETMFSSEAEELLNKSGEGLISYNGVSLSHTATMDNIQKEIAEGRCFIRTMNSNTFVTFKETLRKIIIDGADDDALISYLNSNLFTALNDDIIAQSSIYAPYELNKDMCSPFGSIVAKTICNPFDAEYSMIDYKEIAASLYIGEYTKADVNAMVISDSLYVGDLTRAEIQRVVEAGLVGSTTYRYGGVEPLMIYPILGNLKAKLSNDASLLNLQDKDGLAIDDYKTHTMVISSQAYKAVRYIYPFAGAKFTLAKTNLMDTFLSAWLKQTALDNYDTYFTY